MLVLGSGSPRRRELLAPLGLRWRIAPPEVDEAVLAGELGPAYLERIVTAKAAAVARELTSDELGFLVADTSVLHGDRILGKPASASEARTMLRDLSATSHQVATRFLLRVGGAERSETVRTEVRFRALSEREIERYVEGGEPFDKAGGYAIQGLAAGFVQSIHGSYTNVVGLPLAEVTLALRELGALGA